MNTDCKAVSQITLSLVNNDRRTQLRVATDQDQVDNLVAAMRAGIELPPIDVFPVGDGTFYIADGWHRFMAAAEIARGDASKVISVTVHEGGFAEALKFALGANAAHGLRRTNKDKRHCVEVACEQFPKLSNRAIADLCKVSHVMVNDFRPQVEDSSTCRTGRDGKSYRSKAAQPAAQLDFFDILNRDFAPVVDGVATVLKLPVWLDTTIPDTDKLEGLRAMRKRLKDLDAEIADYERKITAGEGATLPALDPKLLSGGAR
jgi:uncharacterized ParB-like nuclease family protein